MRITRRDFLKYCSIAAGALGLTATDLFKLEEALGDTSQALPVNWIMGATCSGCSTSLLNSIYYTSIQDLLLWNNNVNGISLQYHPTVMAASGTLATDAIHTTSPFVLVVEGAVQTGQYGDFCHIGETIDGVSSHPARLNETVRYLGTHANCAAILAVGTCASFGGIPAGKPNPTTAKGVLKFFSDELGSTSPTYTALKAQTINIPGCPPNPNWIVGPIATVLYNIAAYGVAKRLYGIRLDKLNRPNDYYGQRQCRDCERLPSAQARKFINPRVPGELADNQKQEIDKYCLRRIGCKGPRTYGDCSLVKWHSPDVGVTGVNWCVGAGAPCQGCTQPSFPDHMSPFINIK